MSDQLPSEGRVLKALDRYMDAVDQRKYVCHPAFVARLLQLEERLKPAGTAIIATGATYNRLINFLVRHALRVLAGSRSDPTLACLGLPCEDMYEQHTYILQFCRSNCMPKGGKHGELTDMKRTGVEVMLDILTLLNQVDTVLHNAASTSPSTYFNLILVWLKHQGDAVAPSLVRYYNLASSPAVLLALIDAVAKYAQGNAMNAHVLFSVADYVAQCNSPSQGGAWHKFLLGLHSEQARAFVYSCTLILAWKDVQRGQAHPQIERFCENLVTNAAHLVAARRISSVDEMSCHRLIRERASGRVR